MAYWLVKSEPDVFSWDDLVKAGKKGTSWTGVRNHGAKLHLMAMKPGERVFYYHSNADKAVVGIGEIVKAARGERNRGLGRGLRRTADLVGWRNRSPSARGCVA